MNFLQHDYLDGEKEQNSVNEIMYVSYIKITSKTRLNVENEVQFVSNVKEIFVTII